jgi:Gti1/Pac2 family transcription factor
MSSPPDSHNNAQGSSTTWTEPPWSGWIETTGDALLILEAARRGLIPRVTRRLVDSERKMITSGSVFVFDEDESGIKRWTDGFFWSPSRILGNFLLYRETEKRGAGHRGARNDAEQGGDQPGAAVGDGPKSEGQTLSRPRGETTRLGIDRQRERSLVGSLTNSYKFKTGGMMKKVEFFFFFGLFSFAAPCLFLFAPQQIFHTSQRSTTPPPKKRTVPTNVTGAVQISL